jgi:competence protein ComEA
MAELERPQPRPSLIERAAEWRRFVGSGRMFSAAGSVLIVAAGCWWLLKMPSPPIEAGIPLATGATAPGHPASGAALSTPSSMAPIAPPAAVTSTTSTVAAPLESIVVQAAGAVAVPGVYTLPIGSRVHQLIAAAGGAAPNADLDSLAMASVMIDGQRVLVPLIGDEAAPMPAPTPTVPGAAPATGGGGGGSATAAPVGPVDLNRATADELDGLPGIGPSTAAAIVAWREANGPFASPEDLLEVRGIGPAKLDAIRTQVVT